MYGYLGDHNLVKILTMEYEELAEKIVVEDTIIVELR